MLDKILKENFRWSEKKIQAFYNILKIVGISGQLDEAFSKAAAEDRLQNRAEWVAVLNGILQKYLFPRTPDVTNSAFREKELDSSNVLTPYIEILSGKKVIIPQERPGLPDFQLQDFQKETSIFEEALDNIDADRWEINFAIVEIDAAEQSKMQSFIHNLRMLPFNGFFNVTSRENAVLALLEKYREVNLDLIVENADMRRQAIEFITEVKATISLGELKARLQQKKDSLQFLFCVLKALQEFDVFEPAALEVDRNATYLVGPQGAYAFRVVERVKYAVKMVAQLAMAGVKVEYLPLCSGERSIDPTHDIEVLKKSGFIFKQESGAAASSADEIVPPGTELEMMQLVAKRSVEGLGVTIIPVNAPVRTKRNKAAINEVLQDSSLGYKEKRAKIAAFYQKPLNPADEERPDATFVAVYAAFALCDMIESGALPSNKKIRVLCIAEAPYLGQQTQQTTTGLELAGIPSQIAQNIEFQLTGLGMGDITGTKAILDALGSVAGEIYWGGQRPSLKRALILKDKTESKASDLASALSTVTGTLMLSSNSPLSLGLEERVNVLSFSNPITLPPTSLTGTIPFNTLSSSITVQNVVEKEKAKLSTGGTSSG